MGNGKVGVREGRVEEMRGEGIGGVPKGWFTPVHTRCWKS